jgi:ActR/RegA family two-component response regulator
MQTGADKPRVLFVDDDANILSAYARTYRREFDLDTAEGPEAGAEMLTRAHREGREYAVIVSDMNMPGKNGAVFLSECRRLAPLSVRIMLTGNADQHTATDAINRGEVFRFLTKPCEKETFAGALQAGVRQHRLLTAERDLLQRTLKGSVKVLIDLLAAFAPAEHARATRLTGRARTLAERAGLARAWEVELAAMLEPVGALTTPADLLARARAGQPLRAEERALVEQIPQTAAGLLANIPRLEGVAALLRAVGGEGGGDAETAAGAAILRALSRADGLESLGKTRDEIAATLTREGFEADLIERVARFVRTGGPATVQQVRVRELRIGDVLASDVKNTTGALLLKAGQEIGETARTTLVNHARLGRIGDSVTIYQRAA